MSHFFVFRNQEGAVIGLSSVPQDPENPEIADQTSPDWMSYLDNVLSASDVEAERDRRLASCDFTYDFGDARGVHTIGTDEKDMDAWMKEVMPIAQARLALSDATPIDIVTNTGPVSVTPTEWMDIVNTGGAGRQAIWAYYFALINTDPIPADYTDDQYWSPPPPPEE